MTQEISDIATVASGQNYTVAGVLLVVCGYLAWYNWQSQKNHKEALKCKDSQIMKVVDEHKADLKENNKDFQMLLTKYHSFTEQIKSIANGKV